MQLFVEIFPFALSPIFPFFLWLALFFEPSGFECRVLAVFFFVNIILLTSSHPPSHSLTHSIMMRHNNSSLLSPSLHQSQSSSLPPIPSSSPSSTQLHLFTRCFRAHIPLSVPDLVRASMAQSFMQLLSPS